MAIAAVTDDIDDDILAKLLAVLSGGRAHPAHSFQIVGIHMKDRRAHRLGYVRSIRRRPREPGVCCEPDLVVENNVYYTSSGVALNIAHGQRLPHDSLPRKRRIPVQQHRHGLAAGALIHHVVLLRARFAQDHSIGSLQVRGVGYKREPHRLAKAGELVVAVAEVVLDVARPHHLFVFGVGGEGAFDEFFEDFGHGLVHDVGEHVETPAMRRSDREALAPKFSGSIDEGLKPRNDRLQPLQPKPFGHTVFRREEALEIACKYQPVGHGHDLFLGVGKLILAFKLVTDPVLLVHVGYVHELHSNPHAVRLFEDANHFAQLLRAL
mmetsp:Transcript_9612/g.15211  ORF Transcript_9612/g.15211 Transcript_9612/m.15211 type:complete len:323 (+) Transcript_9612:2786-3754(+)